METAVGQAFLNAGLPGAVAVVALAFGYLCFRELMRAQRDVIAAHEKRADDAKAALRESALALSASAVASQATAQSLADVREALQAMAERRLR